MVELIEDYQRERRKARSITDEDVDAIASAILSKSAGHSCRFNRLDPDVLEAAVEFYVNANKILTDSKGVVGKTLLVLIVTAMFGMLAAGAISEFIKRIPK